MFGAQALLATAVSLAGGERVGGDVGAHVAAMASRPHGAGLAVEVPAAPAWEGDAEKPPARVTDLVGHDLGEAGGQAVAQPVRLHPGLKLAADLAGDLADHERVVHPRQQPVHRFEDRVDLRAHRQRRSRVRRPHRSPAAGALCVLRVRGDGFAVLTRAQRETTPAIHLRTRGSRVFHSYYPYLAYGG
ncbi:hypothetical protein ACFPFX_04630 [Streptomyces mauvecolor]|uniref:Secreted protein n=1 Tax=Streptomyces mauvecolor TaxID=58345 RepID=A0ABV9UGK1_9ACTN